MSNKDPVLCHICPRFTKEKPSPSCWAINSGEKIFPVCDECKTTLEKVAKEWGIPMGSVAEALFLLPVEQVRAYYQKAMEYAMEYSTQPIDLASRYSVH